MSACFFISSLIWSCISISLLVCSLIRKRQRPLCQPPCDDSLELTLLFGGREDLLHHSLLHFLQLPSLGILLGSLLIVFGLQVLIIDVRTSLYTSGLDTYPRNP